jgi:putative exosortase-associated protein (TIGR04073 family)
MTRTIPAVAAILLLLTAPAAFAEEDLGVGMAERAIRGASNAFTGIVEIPMQIGKGVVHGVGFIENEAGSRTVGGVLGLFRGISHCAGRTTYGLLEFCSFWAAAPQTNKGVGVPLDSATAWQGGRRYSLFDPTFQEGIVPVPKKLIRGIGNAVFGIVELPGQTVIGFEQGETFGGVVRGVWFTISRWIYGAYDTPTFLLPNPVDSRGVTFNQEWPWGAFDRKGSVEFGE